MRVLVVDDEAPARRRLLRMLEAAGGIEVVGEAGTGPAALEQIEALRPDLVLLDIQMPELTGLEVLAELDPQARPEVIFVTAFDEYAIRAFEAEALDYLLKPVSEERFRRAIERARERIRAAAGPAWERNLSQLLAAVPRPTAYPARLLVREVDRALLLAVDQIDWIESARNYLVVHCGRTAVTVRGTITGIAARLNPEQFTRISKSHLVRLDRIVELQPWTHGEYKVRLSDGTVLTWTRSFLANLPQSL